MKAVAGRVSNKKRATDQMLPEHRFRVVENLSELSLTRGPSLAYCSNHLAAHAVVYTGFLK